MAVVFLIPLLSAFIGWLAAWVALRMLFFPKQPVRVLGISFQGVFHKRQKEVIEQIGGLIAGEFANIGDVIPHLSINQQIKEIKKLVEARLDEYLTGTFERKHPVLAAFLTDKRRVEFKQEILEEIEFFAPEIIDHVIIKLEKDFDVAGLVSSKAGNMQVDKLEDSLVGILKKEFAFIEYTCAALGLVVGLIQLLLTYLII